MPELNSTSLSELGQIYSHIPSYTLIWTSYTLIDLHCGGGGEMSQPPRLQLPFDLIFRIGPKQLFTFHTFLLLYMIATPAESYLEQLKLSYRNHVSSFSIDILIESLSPAISLKDIHV